MFTIERQQQIIDFLKVSKSATVTQLSKQFFIGEATIRRDLEKLEKQNLVRRTYGGAVLIEGLNAEIPITVRERDQADAKDIIGKLAGGLVNDGDTVILDSSTTTFSMINHLKGRQNLTVITNGVKTASAIGTSLHTIVYCTGGKLRENSLSLVGDQAKKSIENFNVQKMFFSCRGISIENGAMDNSEEEAELRKLMIEKADNIYLLCDSSKFNKKAFYKICELKKINCIITDTEPEKGFLDGLKSLGIKYIW